MATTNPLPDEKTFFTNQFLLPVQQEAQPAYLSQEKAFEIAKERFEQERGYKADLSFTAWKQHRRRQRKRGGC